ncbi:Uncharacterised protein [Mycobacteroides abscessus subsp. abscessus]|nr:Uncharacterised protein [Mycobacteroides abscessus subsp. abscessus]
MESPASALTPFVPSAASITGGSSSVRKVFHLLTPSAGSGARQSV